MKIRSLAYSISHRAPRNDSPHPHPLIEPPNLSACIKRKKEERFDFWAANGMFFKNLISLHLMNESG